jgi:nitroimidazol reductase NimA-like FMN-containing flavoprotein (pyridoxamine 5'-phosphate oxidase superfamily)
VSVDRNGLEILPRSDCLALLASGHLGRVGVVRRGAPVVLPVNYAMLGEDVVFATGTGSKSLAVAASNPVAFEVDDADPVSRAGWSVLVTGLAEQLTSGPDWEAARLLDLHPWIGRHASKVVRLRTNRISGRRLAAAGTGPPGSLAGSPLGRGASHDRRAR